jgi:hypothetical protein
MLFVGTSIIHPSTEGVFLLCNILDLLIYSYKNIKSTDGSWSMMDAEILDMYQYDYESKEVKDLQKTSW